MICPIVLSWIIEDVGKVASDLWEFSEEQERNRLREMKAREAKARKVRARTAPAVHEGADPSDESHAN